MPEIIYTLSLAVACCAGYFFAQARAARPKTTQVEFKLRGEDLVAAGRLNAYRKVRTL